MSNIECRIEYTFDVCLTGELTIPVTCYDHEITKYMDKLGIDKDRACHYLSLEKALTEANIGKWYLANYAISESNK